MRSFVTIVTFLFGSLAAQAMLAQQSSQADSNARASKVEEYETNPAADPARPTITNPAHIPPPGFLQFEQGFLEGAGSPGLNTQFSLVQTTKLSLNHYVMVQAMDQPFARSNVPGTALSNDTGDLIVGAQFLFNDVEEGHGRTPTAAIGVNQRVRSGTAANLDIGGYSTSVLLLVSGNLFGLHYDTNALVNEQTEVEGTGLHPVTVRRAQLGQTLSVTRQITKPFAVSGEIWHFTQPTVVSDAQGMPVARANAVGLLVAGGYNINRRLVLDFGFEHGLTSTSTRWEGFSGFTYLLPHRVFPRRRL